MANLLVVGSANTDFVIKTERFPQPGETLVGGDFFLFQGGKGANQAVAAARMGAEVQFLCKLGKDQFGAQTKASLATEGISSKWILEDPEKSSGVAIITINQSGENQILVAPGSNSSLSPEDVSSASSGLEACDLVLCQLEIPLPAVLWLAQQCQAFEKNLILNPAPAQALPDSLLNQLFLITPNEIEASTLTGFPCEKDSDYSKIASWFLDRGVQNVLLTLGEKGAYFQNSQTSFLVPSTPVNPVDTTAAGDVFNGTLAVALAESIDWESAIHLANRAAAISVTRMGAQASIPYRSEVF